MSAQDDTVTLNLAPIIERVKKELLNRGFTLADNIPRSTGPSSWSSPTR